jgi:hypothetical protein
MAFTDDNGGFAFSCDDAKMCINSSTWNTRLSQIGRVAGPILILTRALPDVDYIAQIVGKRPRDICIVANTCAEAEGRALKTRFPAIRVALHRSNNARVVLIAPDTIWVSSADFGKSNDIEAAVGMHSISVYTKTVSSLFMTAWSQATEII